MKKLFYFATVLLSLSLFSCSSDDDNKEIITEEGYVVKNITITSDGTQSKPLAGGKELTVSGSFATNSDVYIRPYATTKATMDKDAVKLDIAERSGDILKIKTPFLYGKYELLEKEGDKIYTLGDVYFKEAKIITKIENVSGSTITFEYDDANRIKIIKTTDQDGTISKTVSFSYDSKGELNKVETTGNDERILNITQSDGYITIDGESWGQEFTTTLSFNSQGQLIKRVENIENTFDFGGEIEVIKQETVSDYTYDSKGNVVQNITILSIDGVKDDFSSGTKKYKYDESKSFFSNQILLPSWYWVYDEGYTLTTLMVGVINNCIELEAPAMVGTQTTKYSFEYDSDLYPTKIFLNDSEEPSQLISYK